MKNQLSLLAVALLLAQPVLAKDIPLNRAAALANSVTPAASSQAYDDLEQQALAQLRHALQGDAAALTRDRLAHTKQNKPQADTAWLKASGYDFQTRANQQAGIALLSAFSSLPETVVQQNLATVTALTATPYRPPAVRRWPMRKGLATSTSSATRWGRGWATRF